MNQASDTTEAIRSASRAIVRELGFMNSTLAATPYSASAVHTLLELDAHQEMTAAQLVQTLGLDKSSVSRMLAKLVEAGELIEVPDPVDARVKKLALTHQGQQLVSHIHEYGRRQVQSALQHLNPTQQQAVRSGLASYAQALKLCRSGATDTQHDQVEISCGYRPGLLGRITEMHAAYYSQHSGFGQFFESQVATGVAEFATRLNRDCNNVWVATLNGQIVGSVSVDGQDLGNNHAHLRWFILDDSCRGHGVGRKLLSQAIAFCDRMKFPATQLWTFKGLNAARHLYDSFGFELTHETVGNQWGSVVTEQQFTRKYGNVTPLP
ncbi:helix-turn-helix domain-containing GNAT family N-acetyltransferase [Comamonas sp. lk]|uniref:bifunctional helix-turn-helix transcriptional regulator/GNAT family N-acetyltransferase n=1 Tax=Comamonas sp. lk TaxID=2201272 RepID=UPI000EB01AED|nr:helix-turn-helix domain-containing GNAT family N-acetyltransferase [Comamonas sp. lk]